MYTAIVPRKDYLRCYEFLENRVIILCRIKGRRGYVDEPSMCSIHFLFRIGVILLAAK